MKMALTLGIVLLAAALSAFATVAATRDEALTKAQKRHQLVLAWMVPFIGLVLLLAVRHFMLRRKDRSAGDSSLVVEDQQYISKGYFF
jgi:hypothetical protein